MKHGQLPADADPRLTAIPAGVVIMLGFDAVDVPAGFFICRGDLVLQATHPNLFAAIGHKYNRDAGGNPVDPGGGQFRLPDFRRKFPLGPGTGGIADRPNGQRGGAWDHVHAVGTLAGNHAHLAGDGSTQLVAASHAHGHSLYLPSHQHVTTETVKAQIRGSETTRGRSFGGSTQASGNVALTGSIGGSGALNLTGSTAGASPALTGSSGSANPPAIMLNFAIRGG